MTPTTPKGHKAIVLLNADGSIASQQFVPNGQAADNPDKLREVVVARQGRPGERLTEDGKWEEDALAAEGVVDRAHAADYGQVHKMVEHQVKVLEARLILAGVPLGGRSLIEREAALTYQDPKELAREVDAKAVESAFERGVFWRRREKLKKRGKTVSRRSDKRPTSPSIDLIGG